MSNSCLFCRIIAGEIPAKIEYQDENILAFHDINPQAPAHILVIPKKHIEKLGDLQASDAETIGKVICGANQIAKAKNWKDYRLVFNNGAEAGQTVYHIHAHLLSGRKMTWPPG